MRRSYYSDCKCFNCPEADSAACRYLQANNQVKELLLERKVMRDQVAARLNITVDGLTSTNNASPKLPTLEEFRKMIVATHQVSELGLDMNSNSIIIRLCYDIMCRQLSGMA
jgi:hypothetical protein